MQHYRIRVAGHIGLRRATALGCRLEHLPDGSSELRFDAVDPTALYGLLTRLRDAGIELVAIDRRDAARSVSHAKTEEARE